VYQLARTSEFEPQFFLFESNGAHKPHNIAQTRDFRSNPVFVDAGVNIETSARKVSASHEMMRKELIGVLILICINKVDIVTDKHRVKSLRRSVLCLRLERYYG